jgi:choline dehydrogenase-like flavoprotein
MAHLTSLPVATNQVTLDPDIHDRWGRPGLCLTFRDHPDRYGRPGLCLTYRDHPDEMEAKRWFRDRAEELMHAAGAERVWNQPIAKIDGGVHLLGTARMGNDPRDSVVDKYHRAHDVPNLFICDGSSLVTSGRGQPTMTIQALAFRAAEHIARFAKSNAI